MRVCVSDSRCAATLGEKRARGVVRRMLRASTTCPRSRTIRRLYIVSRLFIRRPYTTRTLFPPTPSFLPVPFRLSSSANPSFPLSLCPSLPSWHALIPSPPLSFLRYISAPFLFLLAPLAATFHLALVRSFPLSFFLSLSTLFHFSLSSSLLRFFPPRASGTSFSFFCCSSSFSASSFIISSTSVSSFSP